MRIFVKDGENLDLHIHIPSVLVLNRVSVWILRTALKTHGIELSQKAAVRFLEAMQVYKCNCRDWVLAEIYRADGSEIYVKL